MAIRPPRRPGNRRACRRLVTAAALVPWLVLAPLAEATCGGGGGGGTGGISTIGPDREPQVYPVPWKVLGAPAPAQPGSPAPSAPAETPAAGLELLWFPTSPAEAKASGLTNSRRLTLWSGQCVAPILVPDDETTLHQRHHIAAGRATVVLAARDGRELARVEADEAAEANSLAVAAVERAVDRALADEENRLESLLATGKSAHEAGRREAAVTAYREVAAAHCLFPRLAKKAAKALAELGEPTLGSADPADDARPDLGESTNAAVTAAILAGLAAERALDYGAARTAYEAARAADPADPIALRYLAELHRHHSGDWALANQLFRQLLALPHADPLSRAVALHGLGKMTIHAGDFAGGLALFAQSLAAYPIPLTYRNLAVYWSSEGEIERAWGHVEQALALAPDDVYNRVFAATFLVELGRPDEAATVAAAHADLVEASYNLAAIWAQLGKREKMLELLARHFFTYERSDAVRAKEMQEARDDRVFASFHQDPAFRALTALAETDTTSFRRSPSAGTGTPR